MQGLRLLLTGSVAGAGMTIVLAMTQLAACGGGGSGNDQLPSAPTPTSPTAEAPYRWPLQATVRITSNGPEPAAVVINVGGRVTFINDDVRPREIVSDPYLRHEECPPINRVGFLAPGQQRDSAVFESARSCGFHDHLDHEGLTGRIEIRIE